MGLTLLSLSIKVFEFEFFLCPSTTWLPPQAMLIYHLSPPPLHLPPPPPPSPWVEPRSSPCCRHALFYTCNYKITLASPPQRCSSTTCSPPLPIPTNPLPPPLPARGLNLGLQQACCPHALFYSCNYKITLVSPPQLGKVSREQCPRKPVTLSNASSATYKPPLWNDNCVTSAES